MAQKPEIRFSVKFDQLDKKEIDRIADELNEGLKSVRLDPNLTAAREKLNKLSKENLETIREQEKIDDRISRLVRKHTDLTQKKIEQNQKIVKLSVLTQKQEDTFNRKIKTYQENINKKTFERNRLNRQIISQQKQLADLDKDSEEYAKVNDKIQQKQIRSSELESDITQDQKNIEIARNNVLQTGIDNQNESIKIQQDIQNIIDETKSIEDEISSKKLEQVNLLEKQKVNGEQFVKQRKELFDLENSYLTGAGRSMQEQIDAQHQIAAAMVERSKIQGKETISYSEALDLAKQQIQLTTKRSKLDEKAEKLFTNTFRNKKAEFEFKKKDVKLLDERLKKEGLGIFARKRATKDEEKALLKEYGLRKSFLFGVRPSKSKDKDTSISGSVAALAKGENVAEKMTGQMGALGAIIGKLAGPLMALGGIAGFVMLMLEYNQKVQEARKSILQLGAASGQAWKNIQKGQILGIDTAEKYRVSLRSLYGEIGMTYEDALKNTEILNRTSVAFQNVLSGNLDVLKEIDKMAVLNSMSFEEMATISGEWTTEFRKNTKDLFHTFVDLRNSAAKSDFTTTRFFSSVMNAAQGLAIYGTQVEDVGKAFAYLTKGLSMPQKQAAELATKMLNANNVMSTTQKTMVAQIGAADFVKTSQDTLQTEKAKLATMKAGSKEYKAQQALIQDQENRLTKMTEQLKTKYPDELEKQTRFFESLDPGQQIELRFRALAKAAPGIFKGVNLADPKQLTELLSKNREKLALIGKEFGFDKEQMMFFEDFFSKGKSFSGLTKALAERDKKAEDQAATKQAHIIEQGTKSIKEILAEKISAFVEKIYLTLEDIYEFFANSIFASDATKRKSAERSANKEIEKLEKSKKEFEDREKALIEERDKNPKKWSSKQETELRENTRKKEQFASSIDMLNESKKKIKTAKSGGDAKEIISADISTQERSRMSNDLQAQKMQQQFKGKSTQPTYYKLKQFSFGGYTGDGKPTNAAGIVHKKEFVFDETSTRKIGKENLEKLMAAAKNGFAAGGYVGTAAKLARGSFKIGSAIGTKAMGMTPTGMAIQAGARIALPMVAKALGVEQKQGDTINNNQSVTINVNQRDRQEIEQIVYKVMYDKSARG